MIIRAIRLKTPSLRVTNEDILAAVREANANLATTEVHRYCRQLAYLLHRAGARTRFYRDRAKGETALSLMLDAARQAIDDSGIGPAEVDAVIYCGVARGFLEPANAAFVSEALGVRCDSFDVSEACMSWVRSLHIAYNFLATGAYSTILIVNGEFTVFEHGIPDVYLLRSPEQLRHSFAALTIGEAASATVLAASPRPWRFRFRSDPSLADLCTLPIPGYEDFSRPSARIALNGLHRLVSFSDELATAAIDAVASFVRDTYADPRRGDLWFPHAASTRLCESAARRLGLEDRLYSDAFACYGNLISASIPAAMTMAAQEGRLRRGHRVVLCPVSAGLSCALVEGEY